MSSKHERLMATDSDSDTDQADEDVPESIVLLAKWCFDADYYLSENDDVAKADLDPFEHFMKYGWKEGRNPRPDFSLAAYLHESPDVAESQHNPFLHFLRWGAKEGRLEGASFHRILPSDLSLEARQEYILLERIFDRDFYLKTYHDVRISDTDAVLHFMVHGWRELRNPAESFNTKQYLLDNPDVRLADTNPLLHYLRDGIVEGRRITPVDNVTYDIWRAQNESRDEDQETAQQDEWDYAPLISILMPVFNGAPDLLDAAIESVLRQSYPNAELCIADDASTDEETLDVLRRYEDHPKMRMTFRSANGHIAAATNAALEMAKGEWVGLLDQDDVLAPNALAEVVSVLNARPDAEIVYSDEDKIDMDGYRSEPYFKPDFSRELFRSQNYLNHFTVHRVSNIRAVGGWRSAFDGSQDYDLSLRILERISEANIVHVPKVLYHWRKTPGSTALDADSKDYALDAGLRALQDHLVRTKQPAEVSRLEDIPYYRIRYAVPEPPPLVTIIIPTRDRLELLRACVDSILEKTTYPNFGILVVDNDSEDPATISYLEKLRLVPNCRVLEVAGEFNFSRLNNVAVQSSPGEVVALLNNDLEVITGDWLDEMVSWLYAPDVGCVGAKLYYSDETVQHGGVVLGVGGVAGHGHKHFKRSDNGYFGRLKVVQNLAAVTAACMVVRRQDYLEIGGFNAENLAVAFNDVDFCLRLTTQLAKTIVWTPFAEFYHHESQSRGFDITPEKKARFEHEAGYMRAVWGERLENDPYYSVNLTLEREDFGLRGK